MNDARNEHFSQDANNTSYDQMVMSNIMPVASNGGGKQNIALVNGFLGVMLSDFDNSGSYLHYLPRSRRFKVFNRPKVNQYTKNTNISSKGTAVIFFINQGILIDDYKNNRINSDELEIGSINNVLGSISLQMGLMFMTYELVKYINVKTDEFLSRPEVIRSYNKMNQEFDQWKYQGAPE